LDKEGALLGRQILGLFLEGLDPFCGALARGRARCLGSWCLGGERQGSDEDRSRDPSVVGAGL
jgi:hypothetical protein